MKNRFLQFNFSMLVISTLVLFSCTGDTGPEGPAGEDGTDGINGKNGINGSNGANGKNGNANVVMLEFLKDNLSFQIGSYLGRDASVCAIDTLAVTQNIVDHGTILGYAYSSSLEEWLPLPYSWYDVGMSSFEESIFSFKLNRITIYEFNESGPVYLGGLTMYHFLLITDNTIMKSADSENSILQRLNAARVDPTNYYDVVDYFGLKF